MSQELKQYIKAALEQGADREQITNTLTVSGWAEPVVLKTLEQFVGVDAHGVPIPAPRMQAHQIARDIFVYSLILITLGLNAFALGGLLFNLIEHYVPDAMTNRYYFNSMDRGISWAIAQLFIAFPVYSGLTYWVQKDVQQFPQKRESLIRKLLIYGILGITAVVGLGDLITTLTTYLQGDMTDRFALKALVVLGISSLIFIYYLFEMRRDDVLVRQGGQQ
jgi:hypothetical protein